MKAIKERGKMMRFNDREEAAKQLTEKIKVDEPKNTIVLAMPRGGVPLGLTIADEFNIPLDVILAKKIGHPMNSEFAIGAMAEGGEPLINDDIHVSSTWLEKRVKQITDEIDRRRAIYSELIEKQSLTDKHVILVDDGIATGHTMFAAIESVRSKKPLSISVAVPIIPEDTFKALEKVVDNIYYVQIPEVFLGSVSAYYENFPQLDDYKVQQLLGNQSI